MNICAHAWYGIDGLLTKKVGHHILVTEVVSKVDLLVSRILIQPTSHISSVNVSFTEVP